MKKLTILPLVLCLVLCCGVSICAAESPNSLVATLAAQSELSDSEAKNQVRAVFEAIESELQKGNDVTVRSFGRFYLQHRDARKARNPKTNEAVNVPARKYAKFVSSDALKERLNKK